MNWKFYAFIFIMTSAILCGGPVQIASEGQSPSGIEKKLESLKLKPVYKTNQEWKLHLNEAQFRILREKDTERPFTGILLNNKKKGIYTCAACGLPLFLSSTKFESGTGWPSFYDKVKQNVTVAKDVSFGMTRSEILCARCGGHLGHVFDDGPKPTGLRYCVNSISLEFTAL